jgi:hypothetical protein
MGDASCVANLINISEKQTESKETKNTEKQNMNFLTHICELSSNGEMMCEGLAAALVETNRSVTDVIIKSQSSVGGITAEIKQYIVISK